MFDRTDGAGGATAREARAATSRLAVLIALVGVADFAFGAVYVTVLLGVGLTPAQIGVGFFLSFLLSTAVEVPSGDWGDRWGQRRMATLGLACWGISLAVFALSTAAPPVMLLALGTWAVGQALFSGAPLSLTINSIAAEPTELRQRAVRAASIAKWVGSAAGGLVVFLGADAFAPPVLIGAAGCALVALAVWVGLAWPESERQAPHPSERHLLQRLRLGWASGLGTLLALAVVSSALLSILLFAWQPLVALAGVPVRANGLVLLGLTVLAAGGAALSRFSERIPGSPLDVLVALLVVALLLAAAGWLPGPWTTFGSLGAVEVLTSYALTVVAVRAHSLFQDRFRNLFWSLFSAAMGIAMALSDLLFGLLWERLGITPALATAGAAMAVLVVGVAAWRALRKRSGDRGDQLPASADQEAGVSDTEDA